MPSRKILTRNVSASVTAANRKPDSPQVTSSVLELVQL
jgi:hypothetical protein